MAVAGVAQQTECFYDKLAKFFVNSSGILVCCPNGSIYVCTLKGFGSFDVSTMFHPIRLLTVSMKTWLTQSRGLIDKLNNDF